MDLKVFDGQDKSELSMIEVAHAILAYHGEAMAFADLTNEVQQYLGKSDEEIRERLPQFYTDLNVDGSFISLGDNTWGLRAWYPYESIDEATVGENEEEEDRPKKKRRKVNAFLAGADEDDDVIDYDNDDPEDDDLADVDDEDDSDSEEEDYDNPDYDEDNPLGDDDEDTNLEDQLSSEGFDDEDDDEDDDDEEE
ncbi:DNA-directed RNA polymerase subunit delta [Limosilactobacillus mucosae]|uniref:Probable DNA-directed RNA polymerase subunit delta n=1 Tax=Limosilactobacillus mucosae TaxID=97478 RepID=A0AAJ1HQW9_LIMMU|nr:DNA-directed RNA polymerase subunit delta [Limosilactobacillus mucosae]MDC2829036.1 DNA-directed RNA polymerase subunit delta [Limosilactobacillus mucosae]MDC2836457.1 DNA-directed RNA polymerase subunit delta [Limosilactobacillus mucosae]MDC2848503.1 DNA-directed RNA polymerase subunit delta [Limosilactobacillus mucosae]MDC2852671.1 DNA-directed RNA polymerase subunit delta [Limosilactobacillus mucosae]